MKIRAYNFLNTLVAALFIFLLLILSFHSRIAGDDFFYLWLKNNFGAWNGMIYQYEQWSGRWSAHFLGCLLISGWENQFFMPAVIIFTVSLLFISIRIILSNIFKRLNIFPRIFSTNFMSVLFIASFYFSTYNIGETWFWYIIIITYLWSIIAFLFLADCILFEKKTFVSYLIMFLSAAFIGGASESYALIFFATLICSGLFRCKISGKNISDPIIQAILFSTFVLLFSFSFSAFAPGTEIRHSLLPHSSFLEKIFIAFKSYAKLFVRYLPEKIGYLIAFSLPWIVFSGVTSKVRLSTLQFRRNLFLGTLIFLSGTALMVIPTSFIMSEAGPDRALSIISFSASAYFAFVFFLAGMTINAESAIIKIVFYTGNMLIISVLLFHLYIQSSIAVRFSNAYDERMAVIRKHQEENFTGVLELEKLPPNGMLYWDEISADTTYFTNKHLRNGLKLNFSVRLKTN